MNKTRPRLSKTIARTTVLLFLPLAGFSAAWAADAHPLLDIMQSELDLSMQKLVSPDNHIVQVAKSVGTSFGDGD